MPFSEAAPLHSTKKLDFSHIEPLSMCEPDADARESGRSEKSLTNLCEKFIRLYGVSPPVPIEFHLEECAVQLGMGWPFARGSITHQNLV